MLAVRRVAGATLCLLLALTSIASAQGDTTKVRAAGFYTVEQGARGATVYNGQCVRCHSIADHSGADFRQAWQGQTVRCTRTFTLCGTLT